MPVFKTLTLLIIKITFEKIVERFLKKRFNLINRKEKN